MPGQGRLGDKANVPIDAHGCPACPHPATGPAIQGSPDVNVNRRPALRVNDPGTHAACCAANTWSATQGSATVFINGKRAHRMGDATRHCGGPGRLIEGSPNVIVGETRSGGATGGSGPASAQPSAGGDGARTARGQAGGSDGAHDRAPGEPASEPRTASRAASPTPASPTPASPTPASPTPATFELACTLLTAQRKPRPGERFELTLPDGSRRSGTSGPDGVIRLTGLPTSGSARLVLPDLDATTPAQWKGAQGIAYAPRGVTVPIGVSQVSLPPAVYRGRLTGMLFDSNKSFVLPSAIPGIQALAKLYAAHPGFELMVSGHADSDGPAAYNLALSVERAAAVEAFLQDQVDAWLAWYGADKPAAKRWGLREDQHMLAAQGYYAGPIHGRNDAATKDAVQRFRADRGLGAGALDGPTRRLLVEAYMQTDGTTLPAGTVLRHHGCGEYHPEVAARAGAAEPENRRVELFLFEATIDPAAPATCPPGGCAEYPEWRKRTIETIDVNTAHEVTFVVLDELGRPLPHGKIKIRYPDGRVRDATSDANGTFLARVADGDQLELEIDDTHEAGAGDGLRTKSGTHYHAGGPP